MKLRIEPNDDLIAELKAINLDLCKPPSGIEARVNHILHNVQMLIDALIDNEEGE